MLRSRNIVLFVAALLVFAGSAVAQMPEKEGIPCNEPCMQEGQGGRMEHMKMIPDLSEKQMEQMKEMRVEHMKSMQPLHNQMAEKKARLRTLTTAEKVNMAEVNKMIDEIGSMQTKMMKLREQHRQEVRKMLTEEQRLFFDSHGPMRGMGKCDQQGEHKHMQHMQ